MLKEPEIKLFGRKIYLPERIAAVGGGECSDDSSNASSNETVDCDDRGVRERINGDGDGEEKLEQEDEDQQAGEPSESHKTNASSDSDEKTNPALNEQNGTTDGQQKILKKPDKILPCARCNSMDTKFCYYNNYNVNQPRHFCKSCQRYWTAGGTMRNVPVGAGRRKNKNLPPNCHYTSLSEALETARSPIGFHGLKFRSNGLTLSFGPDSLLCEKATPNVVRNGVPSCIPGLQWPCPWNSGAVPLPPICPPVYQSLFYPAPVWTNAWNQPCPTSPLGKHSRNGELLNPNRSQESSIVVPKTLRIDDPDEAAKSSIWSTLGIKYSREGLFKALQPKSADRKSALSTSAFLQANPAALSRSISFQERV